MASKPRSARSFPHVEFTWIMSSETSVSTGVPRWRGSMDPRPASTPKVEAGRSLFSSPAPRRTFRARERLQRMRPREIHGGRGDVHAHAQAAVVEPRHRERVVDLGGLLVVDGEGAGIGFGEPGRLVESRHRFETGAAGKELEGKAAQEE